MYISPVRSVLVQVLVELYSTSKWELNQTIFKRRGPKPVSNACAGLKRLNSTSDVPPGGATHLCLQTV